MPAIHRHPAARVLALATWAFACALPTAFAQTTERVSLNALGQQGNDASGKPACSADGRIVAFQSASDNLVPGDTNGCVDIFVRDLQTGQTTRVSVDSLGAQANASCSNPSVTADGRLVAFESAADNLVLGDTNSSRDVFVYDRQTGQTTRVSVDSLGNEGDRWSYRPALSADGRIVAFDSGAQNLVPGDTNMVGDVFVHDRQTGQTTRVSVDSLGAEGNQFSEEAAISADGNYVAFESGASNLVPGDGNAGQDAFVHDRQTGQIVRVSMNSFGAEQNGSVDHVAMSADGRVVAFACNATNLVSGNPERVNDVYAHDRSSDQTTLVSVSSRAAQSKKPSIRPALSADGLRVAFQSEAFNFVPGDTNGVSDVFIHDQAAAALVLTKAGACPGSVSLSVREAYPYGTVAILHGPAGVFVQPNPPCQGLTLGVSPPSLGALRRADAVGAVSLNFLAPPGSCGASVQAVDVTTCSASNVLVL